jgi:hypothetical protein
MPFPWHTPCNRFGSKTNPSRREALMETLILKLAVAVIPLVLLVTSVTAISTVSHWYTHRPLAWHRRRRHILRALASGVMLR